MRAARAQLQRAATCRCQLPIGFAFRRAVSGQLHHSALSHCPHPIVGASCPSLSMGRCPLCIPSVCPWP